MVSLSEIGILIHKVVTNKVVWFQHDEGASGRLLQIL